MLEYILMTILYILCSHFSHWTNKNWIAGKKWNNNL